MYLVYRKIKINDYIKYMSSKKELIAELIDSLDYNDLISQCPSLVSFIETDKDVDDLTELQRQYYMAVDDANQIKDRLTTTEKNYFIAKYGQALYDYFTQQRDDHINDNIISGCESGDGGITGSGGGDTRNSGDSVDSGDEEQDIKNNLQYYNNLYTTVNKGIENINKNVTTMVNNVEINKRKIEYRHDVSEKTMRLSGIFNYIYYFIVLFIFIILISKNALDIKKNIILYIVILIFPLIYRYVFMFLVYIYNLIAEYLKVRGPKDVYLNKSLDIKFLDDYDI
tara:strand:+ start:912 stop:1760 length:849 start_codon:yes stop_codon:yes gene_type:complete